MICDVSKLRQFDIGFSTSGSYLSRAIRFWQGIESWRNLFNPKMLARSFKLRFSKTYPSHVFFVNIINGKYFAAEMTRHGIVTDSSIRMKYINDKGTRFLGIRRLFEFDRSDNVEAALEYLYDLKDKEIKYGFEEIARQMGINIRDRSDTMICSNLVESVCNRVRISFGHEPDPLDIWESKHGVLIKE